MSKIVWRSQIDRLFLKKNSSTCTNRTRRPFLRKKKPPELRLSKFKCLSSFQYPQDHEWNFMKRIERVGNVERRYLFGFREESWGGFKNEIEKFFFYGYRGSGGAIGSAGKEERRILIGRLYTYTCSASWKTLRGKSFPSAGNLIGAASNSKPESESTFKPTHAHVST